MNVLIACEESQRVCTAFRTRGHNAFSCDVVECSGGHPEWHFRGDCLDILNGGEFTTMDGENHRVDRWDLIIAHPPCTYLSVCGNKYFNEDKYGDKARQRKIDREIAADFFMKIINADCEKIAVENPVGIMSTRYRKPDCIIQPWQFGHPFTKTTCLWLKGLPKLTPTNILTKPATGWENQCFTKDGRYGGFGGSWGRDENGKAIGYKDKRVARERSKTFQGIADAMAEQWGSLDECDCEG